MYEILIHYLMYKAIDCLFYTQSKVLNLLTNVGKQVLNVLECFQFSLKLLAKDDKGLWNIQNDKNDWILKLSAHLFILYSAIIQYNWYRLVLNWTEKKISLIFGHQHTNFSDVLSTVFSFSPVKSNLLQRVG